MSGLYAKAKEMFANGQIDWRNDTVLAKLIAKGGYTPHLDGDSVLVDAEVVATQNLAGKKNIGGACSAEPLIFRGVKGPETGALVLIHDKTGCPIIYIDDATMTMSPIGTDIKIDWDKLGIFSL